MKFVTEYCHNIVSYQNRKIVIAVLVFLDMNTTLASLKSYHQNLDA